MGTDAKNPIFGSEFWERPVPSKKDDENPDDIYRAVGWTLSQWEQADQELAGLFSVLSVVGDVFAVEAEGVSRAYGAIESNSGRRKAVEAVAEVFFGNYWDDKPVRQSLIDIIEAVRRASRLRDDIAHGIVRTGLGMDHVDYGYFHMPPRYNTGRSYAFKREEDGPLAYLRAKYRYTTSDIVLFGRKFIELRDTIHAYLISVIRKEDGTVPLIDALVASGKIKQRARWYGPQNRGADQ
jgi:hypothetical protein